MRKSFMKRSVSGLLALVVGMMFTISATVEVNAASTKNYQVVSKITTKWSMISTSNGETENDSGGGTTTYTYNKNGLYTSKKDHVIKTKYKRNKKGYITKAMYYSKNNVLHEMDEYTVKSNGDVKTRKHYTFTTTDKKKTLVYTTTFKYYSKGKIKKVTQKYTYGSSHVTNYNRKGYITNYKYSNGKSGYLKDVSTDTYKYKGFKKGLPIKVICKTTSTSENTTSTETYTTKNKYKFNKKGLPTETTSTTVYKDGKTTSTTKCTYNKKGNITKEVFSETTTGDNGYKNTYKRTNTYKYKTVKVPKKYWKAVEKTADSFS